MLARTISIQPLCVASRRLLPGRKMGTSRDEQPARKDLPAGSIPALRGGTQGSAIRSQVDTGTVDMDALGCSVRTVRASCAQCRASWATFSHSGELAFAVRACDIGNGSAGSKAGRWGNPANPVTALVAAFGRHNSL